MQKKMGILGSILLFAILLFGCASEDINAENTYTEETIVLEIMSDEMNELQEDVVEAEQENRIETESIFPEYISESKEIFSCDNFSIHANFENIYIDRTIVDSECFTIPVEIVNKSDFNFMFDTNAYVDGVSEITSYNSIYIPNDGEVYEVLILFSSYPDISPEKIGNIYMDFSVASEDLQSVVELETVTISDLQSNNPQINSVGVKTNTNADSILGIEEVVETDTTMPVQMEINYPTVRMGNDQSGYYDHPIIGEYAITPMGEEVLINTHESYMSQSITVVVEVTAHDKVEQYETMTWDTGRGGTLTDPSRDYDEFGNVIFETGTGVINGMETMVMTTRYDMAQSCAVDFWFNTESKYVKMSVTCINLTTEQFVEAVNVVMSSYSFGSFPMGFYQTQICMP